MILVTGGTGLVGSHLLFELANAKKEVRAVYRTEKAKDKVKTIFEYYSDSAQELFDSISWIQADITDIPSMIPAFEGVTAVYHAAALISFNPKDYREMRKVNIHGTAIVVNLAIDAGVKKLCYVSSIAAVGDNPSKAVIDEENEWNGNDNNHGYAISKYGGEMEIWRASQEGVDVVIVNPGVILGPGFWSSGSGEIFAQVAKGMPFFTEGVTGFVGVKDVVRAMVLLMQSEVKNERFILVAENISYKDMLTEIASALNVKPPKRKVSPWMTGLFWRWEALKTFLTGAPPKMTKLGARSLHTASFYENDKIKKAIDFVFEDIAKVVKQTVQHY